jgi:hypothetical protein
MAPVQEIKLQWDDPNDSPDQGPRLFDSMFSIVQAAYHFRGGKDSSLPGAARIAGDGRADAHVAIDASGELYFFSKSDGMLRVVVGAK